VAKNLWLKPPGAARESNAVRWPHSDWSRLPAVPLWFRLEPAVRDRAWQANRHPPPRVATMCPADESKNLCGGQHPFDCLQFMGHDVFSLNL